jgi:hypothetical protein
MKYGPAGVHRVPQGERRPAEWYVIWLGESHAEGSVILGRMKRLRRHMVFRVFPEDGSACREIRGLVAGEEWLLEMHRKAQPAPD